MKLDAHLAHELQTLHETNLYRALRPAENALLNFASNDYLGFATHPALRQAAETSLEHQRWGAGASRLICGNWASHQQLDEALATFKGTAAALSFQSGTAAALGTIPALVKRGDVVILDKLCHACLVDGARLSQATLRVYPHRDLNYLEHLLRRHEGQRQLIITESVFSMDGDTAPLRDLVALKERYGAWLMVDEAHATGLFGDKHRGWVEAQGVSDHVEVQMGTLSKALGSSGGYIAGSRPLIDWLVNRARSLIFSTAPSPVVSAASLAALQLIQSDEGATLKARLWKNVRAFSNEAVSPICPVLLGDEAQTCVAADMLRERGYWTPAIRYPTVARGQARLRITLSAQHTLTEIENLKDELGRLR